MNGNIAEEKHVQKLSGKSFNNEWRFNYQRKEWVIVE